MTSIPAEREQAPVIRMEVRSVDQLLDPENSPFPGPRLDPAAGERILNMARNSPKATNFIVEFTVPVADLGREDEVRKALDVLAWEAMEDAEKELREIFRNGRFSLFIGFIAVALLMVLTELLLLVGGESATVRAITESLIIVYWVILWRPAELLLYDHFPVRRRRGAARALARSELRLVSANGGGRKPWDPPAFSR
jgi:hypothetical protein